MPLTFAQGYAQNPGVYYGLINPNLRTPYVQQWNFTIQHEIKGTIIEARYVGNHATKLCAVSTTTRNRSPRTSCRIF